SEEVVSFLRSDRGSSNGEALQERGVLREVIDDLSREGIPEDSDAAANNQLVALAERLPGKAQTRRPFKIGQSGDDGALSGGKKLVVGNIDAVEVRIRNDLTERR